MENFHFCKLCVFCNYKLKPNQSVTRNWSTEKYCILLRLSFVVLECRNFAAFCFDTFPVFYLCWCSCHSYRWPPEKKTNILFNFFVHLNPSSINISVFIACVVVDLLMQNFHLHELSTCCNYKMKSNRTITRNRSTVKYYILPHLNFMILECRNFAAFCFAAFPVFY